MKTINLQRKGSWLEVLNDCRATVRKEETDKEPSNQFKRSILIAEHSPIRDISFRWKWLQMPYWVSVHWVRHKWECFVSTQRTDRTGEAREDKPQSAPVDFTGEANVQHLIDTWRKRLCHQASPETRAYAEDFKRVLEETDKEIARVLVPNCVYRGGCPELNCCGEWQKFITWTMNNYDADPRLTSIAQRYKYYRYYTEDMAYERTESEE